MNSDIQQIENLGEECKNRARRFFAPRIYGPGIKNFLGKRSVFIAFCLKMPDFLSNRL